MNPLVYEALNTECKILKRTEKMVLGTERQLETFIEDGIPEVVVQANLHAIQVTRRELASRKRALPKFVKEEPEGIFIEHTTGLSSAVLFLLGLLPPIIEFPTVSKLWKYLGLDVRDGGRSPKREKGKRAGYDSFLRAVAVVRIGDPLIKCTDSPYRRLYDNRKEYTLITHPPMEEEAGVCPFCDAARGRTKEHREASHQKRERKAEGWDCAGVGGPHWSKAHRHADARRVMVKAVICDLWRVSHGMSAKLGGHLRLDIHNAHALQLQD
jgi:hypothetical protein